MRVSMKASLLGLAALGLAAAAAPSAWAGCGDGAVRPASWSSTPNADLLTLVADQGDSAIVGMWSMQMVAGGTRIDFGYQQFHSDGTEIMNSGGRAPATENFCLGVWAKTGAHTYHLNHFALSYDNSGALNAKVNIKEDVTVRQQNTFSGPFTIDVYDPNSGALLQHVAGQVTAQRVPLN